jgi:multimeric flavodoxin WrbA
VKKHLLILFHSQGGNTEKLAEACLLGAQKEEEVEIRYKKALDTSLDDVIWADGIIIGTPEYFGNMSGALKDFFDRTYYPARDLAINLPYALFICCENDGSGAERNVDTIASGYILKKALNTLIIKEKDLENRLSELDEMGNTFAAGLAMGIF